jgi:site-specific recombinase XerD
MDWLRRACLTSPLALRHAYATHMLEGGLDLFALHRLLGHQNLGVTRRYVQAAVALRGAAYARSHPLMRGQRSWPGWKRADLVLAEEDEGQDGPEDRVATPTVQEVAQLLGAARNPRDACLLRLYYATGVRRNELIHAFWGDLVEEERRLFVRSGKGDQDRYVLVDPGSLQRLRQWCPSAPAGERIFDLKESRVGEIFRHCADRCGLRARYAAQGQKLTLHSLRHAFASHCYANGMELPSLKRLLGHARISTTALYTECPWDHCQASYERLWR